MWTQLRKVFERTLEIIVTVLMIALVVVVVVAVIYRKAGDSLAWYDEVAEILLAWLTYYGAALAAYKRAHIGFDGIVEAAPPKLRLLFVLIAEACVITFFVLLAWMGIVVLDALAGDTLVSLPMVQVKYTQSVIPIGAILFVIAQLLSLPDVIRGALNPNRKEHMVVEP
jgi:TRAP-type C4-dicarboxylate transport system permease small subunit